MTRPADRPAHAKRLIREAEARVARQAAVVEGFELAGDGRAVERAGETLAVLRTGLALALFYLAVETAGSDDGPDRRAHEHTAGAAPPAGGGLAPAMPSYDAPPPRPASPKNELPRAILMALDASPEALTTKQITVRVLGGRGLNLADPKLARTAQKRVWAELQRLRLRKRVASERSKGAECLWRLAG